MLMDVSGPAPGLLMEYLAYLSSPPFHPFILTLPLFTPPPTLPINIQHLELAQGQFVVMYIFTNRSKNTKTVLVEIVGSLVVHKFCCSSFDLYGYSYM